MPHILNIKGDACLVHMDRILEIENLSFPTPWSRKSFLDETKNPISRFWGIFTGEILEGYICFWVFTEEVQVINIAVHPQKRKQGLGHYLLTKVIDESIPMKIKSIWLEVRPSNHPARQLYKKLNFIEVGRRPRYYRDSNEDAIVMSLSLG